VLALSNLDPTRTTPRRNQLGFIEFVFDNRIVISGEDMIHITDMRRAGDIEGQSRIDQLKDVLGISRALDEWSARYFGQGTVSSGIISYPGDMTGEQADRLKEQFEKNSRGMRNAHRPNILTGGAKYERMSDDAAQAQLVEAKKFAVEEVCRIFKIQPSMLGSQVPGARAYASQEQDSVSFVTITLRPLIYKIEEAFGRLLRPVSPLAFLRFNMEGLLRGDIQSRYAAYSQGIQAGFLSINDIRRLEDLRDVDGGDVIRVPLSHVNLEAAGIVETDRRINMAVRLINVGFDPEATLTALNLPSIEHTGLPSVQLQATTESDAPSDDSGNAESSATSASAARTARELSIAEMVQKVYLGVGKVITSDEAREIVNGAGANLAIPGPEFSPAAQAARSLEIEANAYPVALNSQREENNDRP
jgi:HK97 family phage portal protein